ncbi:hypothetical protein F6X40_23805 [Paraburkholderia sp. UCT31]|uniref:hypothetical protein n=1 Tax=Paraburkholderia sp. UCT31 TaxID=2615209 RepID=UPI0016555D19|nr:hypothetical protein [Paraburkholderia sp. UCT31]MBC8739742.1 hypothetical protein [Paraburkholderia sp. UCT31]
MSYQPQIPENLNLVAPAGETPQFQHDCNACAFLGRYVNEEGRSCDLYYHGGHFQKTVIARFSSEGPNYSSGLDGFSYGRIDHLSTARLRAQTLGLHQYDVHEALRDYVPGTVHEVELHAALPTAPEIVAYEAIKAGEVEKGMTILRTLVTALQERRADVVKRYGGPASAELVMEGYVRAVATYTFNLPVTPSSVGDLGLDAEFTLLLELEVLEYEAREAAGSNTAVN